MRFWKNIGKEIWLLGLCLVLSLQTAAQADSSFPFPCSGFVEGEDPLEHAACLLKTSRGFLRSHVDMALHYATEGCEVLQAENILPNDTAALRLQADLYLQRGKASDLAGDVLAGLYALESSLEGYRSLGDSLGMSDVWALMGRIYNQGRFFGSGDSLVRKAMVIREARGDSLRIVDGWNEMAFSAVVRRREAEAAHYARLVIRATEGKSAHAYRKAYGLAHQYLAASLRRSGQNAAALEPTLVGLEVARELEEAMDLLSAHRRLALYHVEEDDYAAALEELQKALKVAKNASIKRMIPYIYGQMAGVNAGLGRYKKAYELARAEFLGSRKVFNAKTAVSISELKQKQAVREQALVDSLRTVNLLEAEQLKTEAQRTISWSLAVGALLLLALAITLWRSFRASRRSNVRLQSAQERTEAARQELEVALEEKGMLVKEIHHRVKNNLQMVSTLLQLQSSHVEDEVAKAAISEGKNRLQSVSLIHQQLYTSEQSTQVDFHKFVRGLVNELAFAYGAEERKIQLEMEIPAVELDVDVAIPLGLILHELLNNALKYAFPGDRSGTISVKLQEIPADQWQLEVVDDGVGMPNKTSDSSLGMKLVRLFTEQLKGELEVQSDAGTSFVLTFPR